jgi:hypothetical protein
MKSKKTPRKISKAFFLAKSFHLNPSFYAILSKYNFGNRPNKLCFRLYFDLITLTYCTANSDVGVQCASLVNSQFNFIKVFKLL